MTNREFTRNLYHSLKYYLTMSTCRISITNKFMNTTWNIFLGGGGGIVLRSHISTRKKEVAGVPNLWSDNRARARTSCSVIQGLTTTSPLPKYLLLYCKIYVLSYRGWKFDTIIWITWRYIHIGSEMNFHFIRYLWNELCGFISPRLKRLEKKCTKCTFHSAATGINI